MRDAPLDVAALRTIATTIRDAVFDDERQEDYPLHECAICRASFSIDWESEPTALCEGCAWRALDTLTAGLLEACAEVERLRALVAWAPLPGEGAANG